MADNLTLQTTPATPAAGKNIASYEVTFSGDTAHVAPVVLGTISGTEGSRTLVEISSSNPLPVSDAGSTLSVDDGAGSLTVDGTVAATQSGTWNVGTVTTVTTVSTVTAIGTSVTPGTSAGHLGKAVDAVAGASDTGVAVLAVRDDSLSTLTPVDGDYTHLRVNSQGALHVTGAGGGTQFAEDTAHTTGDVGTMLLAVRRDANTTLVDTTGDYAPLQVDANGALKVVGSSGTTQYVEDTAAAGAESLCLVGAVQQASLSALSGDGDYAYVKVDALGRLYVQMGGGASTGTVTSVNDVATSTTLLASNANRRGFIIYNDSTVTLYVKLGATASTTSFTYKLLAGESIDKTGYCYTGVIDGIWASDASGAARITELT